jgi:predicted amidohydrolase
LRRWRPTPAWAASRRHARPVGQLEPAADDVAGNAATVCDALAAHPDAELAVFPELFLCGYDLARIEALAIDVADHSLALIADGATATETVVVVGFAERTPEGVANSVACLAPGTSPVVYRKANLSGPASGQRSSKAASWSSPMSAVTASGC